MPVSYDDLLEATIQHLNYLKEQGCKYLPVSADIWKSFSSSTPVAKAPARTGGLKPPQRQTAAPPPAVPKPAIRAKSETAAIEVDSGSSQGFADMALPVTKPITSTAGDVKATAIAQIRERALACQKCSHLVRSRTNVVFGVGDIHSQLMFVGEAPGADEDREGEPFVGRAGQLLTKIIQTMGYSRETVYIANVLKCRPDTPGQTSGNRKPTAEEMKTCLPYLLAQIDVIQPKAIVALGATAMEGLFGNPVAITKARGKFLRFRDIPVMPTYHPSYLLRNAALSVKRELWEDMLQVLELLARPISEKQRNYFLK